MIDELERKAVQQRAQEVSDRIFEFITDMVLTKNVSYKLIMVCLRQVADHIEKELKIVEVDDG